MICTQTDQKNFPPHLHSTATLPDKTDDLRKNVNNTNEMFLHSTQ